VHSGLFFLLITGKEQAAGAIPARIVAALLREPGGQLVGFAL
jgi:hypothetical protein